MQADLVRQELARILESEQFKNAPRQRRLLTYLVEEFLAGRADEIKQSTIGVGVFDREPDWDPKLDSIVRTEATKLRRRLDEYYSQPGMASECRIWFPKGGYVPAVQTTAESGSTGQRSRKLQYVVACLALLLPSAWIAWKLWQPVERPRAVPLRISSDLGMVDFPTVSRSGEWVAYSSNQNGGQRDLYVKHVNGNRAIRLTSDPAEDIDAEFSPDGSEIAFTRLNVGVFTVQSTGGKERLVFRNAICPHYSPNGKWIVFDAHVGNRNPAAVNSGRMYLANRTTGELKPVCEEFASAHGPIWTPDGNHLLFLGGKSPDATSGMVPLDWWVTGIDRCNAVPTGFTDLLSSAPKDSSSTWPRKPDPYPRFFRNDEVMFYEQFPQVHHWKVKISTSNWRIQGTPQRLKYDAAGINHVALSGDHMVVQQMYLKGLVYGFDLDEERAKLRDKSAKELVSRLDGLQWLSLSAGAHKVAYTLYKASQNVTEVLNLKDNSVQEVATGNASGWPVVSRDGGTVFLHLKQEDGKLHLVGHNIATGVRKEFCTSCQLGDQTEDHQWLIVAKTENKSSEVATISRTTGEYLPLLVDHEMQFLTPAISREGNWLAFRRSRRPDVRGTSQIWVSRIQNGKAAPRSEWIAITQPGEHRSPIWSGRGKVLYFLAGDTGPVLGQMLKPKSKLPIGEPIQVIAEAVGQNHIANLGVVYRGYDLRDGLLAVPAIYRLGTLWLVDARSSW